MKNFQKVKFLINENKKSITAYIDINDLKNEFSIIEKRTGNKKDVLFIQFKYSIYVD